MSSSAFNLTGTYHSNKSEYKIVQTGNQIKGYYGNFGSEHSTGQIWGEIEGNTVKLEWYDPGGSTGTGELTISPDGSEWRGTWITTNRKHKGKWKLTRVD